MKKLAKIIILAVIAIACLYVASHPEIIIGDEPEIVVEVGETQKEENCYKLPTRFNVFCGTEEERIQALEKLKEQAVTVELYDRGQLVRTFMAFDDYFCYNDDCSIKRFLTVDNESITTSLEFIIK